MNTRCISSQLHRRFVHSWGWQALWCVVCAIVLLCVTPETEAKSKPRAPRPEPELKILDLKVTPTPYSVTAGPLEFAAVIQLPKELNGSTILEVSSLITSPSRTSLRFLTIRKSIQPHRTADGADPPQVSLTLSWDGFDHKKQPAGPGTYAYEVRAKLLANGEKGPRTMMVSWPKRGTLEVK